MTAPAKPSKAGPGKAPWELNPWEVDEHAVLAMAAGNAADYAPDSWRDVDPKRFEGALMRHFMAMRRGEVFDPEAPEGFRGHVTHAGAFLATAKFIAWHALQGAGLLGGLEGAPANEQHDDEGDALGGLLDHEEPVLVLFAEGEGA